MPDTVPSFTKVIFFVFSGALVLNLALLLRFSSIFWATERYKVFSSVFLSSLHLSCVQGCDHGSHLLLKGVHVWNPED